MSIGLYVARCHPLHIGHYNRKEIALREGYVDRVILVLFQYTNKGVENPTYHHMFSLEERAELSGYLGIETIGFRVELSRGWISNLNPVYVWRRGKQLLSEFGGDCKVMTNSLAEMAIGRLFFRLPMVYVPKFEGEPNIKAEKIRRLLLEDKINEAAAYVPPECREAFIKIVRKKDVKRLYQERNYRTRKIGPFRVQVR